MIKYTDIFVPGGFPIHTYNPRASKGLEEKLDEAQNNLCKLITVTGQTKSGKTVLTKKIYPKDKSIWVDGGAIKSEEEFWNSLLEQMNYYQSETAAFTEETSGGSANEDLVKGELGIIGGSKKYTVSEGDKTASTVSRTKVTSSKISVLRGLVETKTAIVIDDFHYIGRNLQGDLIRALKSPIFEGVPVIIIAIPHRRYDAMKVEKEMTGRISLVQIPMWANEELQFIADTGFGLLTLDIDPQLVTSIAKEAVGSPHLMQEFCRRIAKLKTSGGDITQPELETLYKEIAENIGRPIFEKLMKGPRQRADRMKRQLKDGREVDIYGLILIALAHLKPGLISIEYEDLRQSIREVIQSSIPQLHEVARVLKHMSNIAATDESSAPVIDFDDAEKKLHITDPFFSFYLKWGAI